MKDSLESGELFTLLRGQVTERILNMLPSGLPAPILKLIKRGIPSYVTS